MSRTLLVVPLYILFVRSLRGILLLLLLPKTADITACLLGVVLVL